MPKSWTSGPHSICFGDSLAYRRRGTEIVDRAFDTLAKLSSARIAALQEASPAYQEWSPFRLVQFAVPLFGMQPRLDAGEPHCKCTRTSPRPAGIYAPPDGPFPEDGVLAIGEDEAPRWVFADLDLLLVAGLTSNGGVLSVRHWAEQGGTANPPACRIVSLV